MAELIDANKSGAINYLEFVGAFKVEDAGEPTWQAGVIQQVANVLYQHRIQIRNAFRMFDSDNNGVITREEFSQGLLAINSLLDKPLSTVQVEELMNALDKDKDGSISFDEFLHGFSIVDTATNKTMVAASEPTV